MKIQRTDLDQLDRYTGFVNKLCPTFGFLRIYNADPELQIFFCVHDCGYTVPFDQIKLNDRFRFGVQPSNKVLGGLCVRGLKPEFPPAGDKT